jgi:hypothetical protein
MIIVVNSKEYYQENINQLFSIDKLHLISTLINNLKRNESEKETLSEVDERNQFINLTLLKK